MLFAGTCDVVKRSIFMSRRMYASYLFKFNSFTIEALFNFNVNSSTFADGCF